jgi:2-dehydro-3-deoxygluconokinase
MKYDLVGMGEPMLEFSQLPPGPDQRRLYLEGYGGDTSNATVAATRHGARTAYITALGRDFAGERFIELWQREGVDTAGVIRLPTLLTAVYFIFYGPNGHAFVDYRERSAASALTASDLPREILTSTRVFFASGVSQGISPNAADAVFAAIDIVRSAGGVVAYDTNYRPRLWPSARAAAVMQAAIEQAEIVFPGMEDSLAMLGLSDPDRILDHYLRVGPKIAVLKMGDQGAYLATPKYRIRVPAHRVNVVDASGAGDTFCGSFLARWLAGDDPEHAAHYATMAAALKCTGYGAVAPIPRQEDVWAALRSRSPTASRSKGA